MVVVVRYFGGTLLGTRGLIRAYKSAANDVLSNAKIIKQTVQTWYEIQFEYEAMNPVEKMLHDLEIQPREKSFGEKCVFTLGIRKSREQNMLGAMKKIRGLYYNKINPP
jgi:putative IMPACT (imprinted ancient) family translation regulator